MTWRRGITRIYLVVWFLWAAALTYPGILSHLRYGPATKLVQVPGPDTTYPHPAATDTTFGPEPVYWDFRPVGPPRLHFEHLKFGDAMATLGLAFVLPAILLIAFRWIVAGFQGRGAPDC